MKSSVFAALLACAIATAAAQDANTGGQAGSVMADVTTPTTTPPITTAPGMAAPNAVDPAPPAPPSAATSATQAPGSVWAANPAPMTDSGSGNFASAGDDIEVPVTKKPKRVTDSQSSSSAPSEASSAPMLTAAAGAWTLAGLLGLVAML